MAQNDKTLAERTEESPHPSVDPKLMEDLTEYLQQRARFARMRTWFIVVTLAGFAVILLIYFLQSL